MPSQDLQRFSSPETDKGVFEHSVFWFTRLKCDQNVSVRRGPSGMSWWVVSLTNIAFLSCSFLLIFPDNVWCDNFLKWCCTLTSGLSLAYFLSFLFYSFP